MPPWTPTILVTQILGRYFSPNACSLKHIHLVSVSVHSVQPCVLIALEGVTSALLEVVPCLLSAGGCPTSALPG